MGRVWGFIALLMCFYRANASAGKNDVSHVVRLPCLKHPGNTVVNIITSVVNVLGITRINPGIYMSKLAFSVSLQMV